MSNKNLIPVGLAVLLFFLSKTECYIVPNKIWLHLGKVTDHCYTHQTKSNRNIKLNLLQVKSNLSGNDAGSPQPKKTKRLLGGLLKKRLDKKKNVGEAPVFKMVVPETRPCRQELSHEEDEAKSSGDELLEPLSEPVSVPVSEIATHLPQRETVEIDELEMLMEEGSHYVDKAVGTDNRDSSRGGRGADSRDNRGSRNNQLEDVNEFTDPEKCTEIQELVNKRAEFRYERNFEMADAVREQLLIDHQVEIYDRRNIWISGDGRKGPLKGAENSMAYADKIQPAAPIKCTMDPQEIQKLVELRTSFRRRRDFHTADQIRDDLAARGIEVMDRSNEWRSYDGQLFGQQSHDRQGGNSDEAEEFNSRGTV